MKTQQKAKASFIGRLNCRLINITAQELNLASPGDHGFTLVELIVVVTIIGILATMAVPAYNDLTTKAKNSSAKADIRTLEDAIGAYFIDQNKLPAQLSDLGQQGNLKDPWGNPYEYYNIGTGTGNGTPPRRYTSWAVDPNLNYDYDLYSKGADGKTNNKIVQNDPTDVSNDDIVRVGDGGSIELASEF